MGALGHAASAVVDGILAVLTLATGRRELAFYELFALLVAFGVIAATAFVGKGSNR